MSIFYWVRNALLFFFIVFSPLSWSGFSVKDGQLLDSNGNPFIMRGINHAHAWWPGRTPQSLKDIAKTGANTARIVLTNGTQWSRIHGHDVAKIVTQCKENMLVCILEVHDTTGYGEHDAASHISAATDYWLSDDIRAAIKDQEEYVIINIANEPFGNGVSESTYVNDHITAIQTLRDAGIEHTLMVDAANWGQDWQFYMRDNAKKLFESDPNANVIFDVHMYEVYNSAKNVEDYIRAFVNNKMVLIIGEFGDWHQGKNVDEKSIMMYAEKYGVGYLGWSWSGNGNCCADLDVAKNWTSNRLSDWGETLLKGKNGIAKTSVLATTYTGDTPTPNPVEENVAEGKPVVASSNDGYGGNPEMAVDGSDKTRWASSWNDEEWIYIDLEQSHDISKIVLHWEAAYGSHYEIQLSDDLATWSTIFVEENGDGKIDEIEIEAQGRYVRFMGVERGTQWGYSLWEFEVYGKAIDGEPDPDPATLELSEDRLQLEAEAKSVQVKVMSNVAWTAASDVNWIKISHRSGNGDKTLTFEVKENAEVKERTGTVTVSSGTLEKTIAVTQAGREVVPPQVGQVIEAEDATLRRARVRNSNSASGNKYVEMGYSGSIEWTVNVEEAGSYTLSIGYREFYSRGQQTLEINGVKSTLYFGSKSNNWSENSTTVELKAGENRVKILNSGWSWIDFDFIKIN